MQTEVQKAVQRAVWVVGQQRYKDVLKGHRESVCGSGPPLFCCQRGLLMRALSHLPSLTRHPLLVPHTLLSPRRGRSLASPLPLGLTACHLLLSRGPLLPGCCSSFASPLLPPASLHSAPGVCPSLFIPCSFFLSLFFLFFFFLAHVSSSLLTAPHLGFLAVTRRFVGQASPRHWAGCRGRTRSPPPRPWAGVSPPLSPLLAAVLPPVPGTRLHGGAGPLLWRGDRVSPGVPALAGRGVPGHQGERAGRAPAFCPSAERPPPWRVCLSCPSRS